MAKRAPRKKKCPVCRRPAEADTAPFCSKRCADEDLARWLGGDYRIPTNEQQDEQNNKED
jgi:endogenous inhibitor of DNA gyrase (YacG/DUF329 family)